ncbi:hypothetical protein H0E87_016612 [Populus deltoides]|uniref:Uncharacterized protein n=1 Tax=Populus deltoides TaxID=3696 RepID=A0A8T2Y9T8_POPDE|nr:hypothetical protein H0E87_016612 [Populus deltoides]
MISNMSSVGVQGRLFSEQSLSVDNCEFPKRRFCREGHDSIWATMKEYGDAKSWIKVFNNNHLKGRVSDFVGFKKNASSTSTDNSSGNEETKEHSSHVAGLDKNKKEKKKKGIKIMEGPEIVDGEIEFWREETNREEEEWEEQHGE